MTTPWLRLDNRGNQANWQEAQCHWEVLEYRCDEKVSMSHPSDHALEGLMLAE